MTQSLTGIEPINAGSLSEAPSVLSGLADTDGASTPSMDPSVAERFQSAMIDCQPVGRDVPIAPQDQIVEAQNTDAIPLRRLEDKPPYQNAITSVATQQDTPDVAQQDAMAVGRDVSIAPQDQVVEPQTTDAIPVRRLEDKPPYQNAITSVATQQDTPNVAQQDAMAVGRDDPIAPQHQVAEPQTTDAIPVRRLEDKPPYQNAIMSIAAQANSPVATQKDAASVGRDAPIAPQVCKPFPKTVGRDVPIAPQTMIIAPVPLPIELPAATAPQQSAAAAAPHDVVRMFVAAAEAVADAILVSSGFENGEGRILVRLQPEVLGGSEVQITAKGGMLTVVVNPASQDVQTIVEANRTQFEQHLAEKVHSWRVAVAVKRGEKTDERV